MILQKGRAEKQQVFTPSGHVIKGILWEEKRVKGLPPLTSLDSLGKKEQKSITTFHKFSCCANTCNRYNQFFMGNVSKHVTQDASMGILSLLWQLYPHQTKPINFCPPPHFPLFFLNVTTTSRIGLSTVWIQATYILHDSEVFNSTIHNAST